MRFRLDVELDGDRIPTPTRFDLERIILDALVDRMVRERVPWETDDDRLGIVKVCVWEGPCSP